MAIPNIPMLPGKGLSFGIEGESNKTNIDGLVSKRRVFDQAAIDKLIYDTLSSDRGLASLASGENLSAGFNSSTKTLQTQDFLTKLIGELAVASSEEITKEDKTVRESKKKGKFGKVICTELTLQGYLSPELYQAGGPPSKQASYTTWSGYHCWAVKVVEWMKTRSWLCKILAPIVRSRYKYLTKVSGWHVLGRLTVYMGHPICWLIGIVLKLRGGYARANEFT